MLCKFPNHDFDELKQIYIFRNEPQPQPKLLLDAAAGSLLYKSVEDAISIINHMAFNDHQVQYNRGTTQGKPGILDLGANGTIIAQNKLLTQIVEELTKQLSKLPKQLKEMHEASSKPQQVAFCELCTGDHPTGFCPPINEEVNYMGNQQRPTLYQGNQGYQCGNNSNYGQGWRQGAGSSNRPNQYHNFHQQPQNPPQPDITSKLEDTLNQFMRMSIANHKNTDASFKNLETQVG